MFPKRNNHPSARLRTPGTGASKEHLMKIYPRGLAATATALSLAFWLPGAGDAAGDQARKTQLPHAAIADVIRESVKEIQAGLKSKPEDKTTAALVRTNAVII